VGDQALQLLLGHTKVDSTVRYLGVELEDDHWLLIDFLHRFYSEYAMAPELPVLARNLCKDQKDCRWTRKYINELFPGGAKTACRYAGLPFPVGRSCV